MQPIPSSESTIRIYSIVCGIASNRGTCGTGLLSGPLVGMVLTPQARDWANEMIEAGHKVQTMPIDPLKKTAVFIVDGVVTEYKGLNSAGPTTIKNAIQKAVGQGESVVIDARRTPVSSSKAYQQIQRAAGNIGSNLQGRITVLTKDGTVKY